MTCCDPPELLLLERRASHERDCLAGKGGEQIKAGPIDERHVTQVECDRPARVEYPVA